MDWMSLPSLTALRAFAALAETGSVVSAGARLNVSHAAISQQIKALEDRMSVALVDRTGRQLVLTPQGQQLADTLINGFGAISRTVEALTGANESRPLHIATTPMFASSWLAPQMAGFHAIYPNANIIISTTPKVQLLEPGGIDVALRYGDGNWPGLESELLFASSTVIVGAPSLVGSRVFEDPAELCDLPLLQGEGVSESSNWLERSIFLQERTAGLVQMPSNLLLDAARDGRGVVALIRAFVENDIAAGRLQLLFEHNDNKGFHIVTRPGFQRPALKTFLKWLRKCCSDCALL